MPEAPRRRVYCVGDVGVPEADTFEDVAGGQKANSDHKMLNVVWDMASSAGRLFYRNNTPSSPTNFVAGSLAGSLAGLYALRHAAIGRATEGMDTSIRHVASLDSAFSAPGVRIAKVASANSGSSVLLLSTGVAIGLSRDQRTHRVAVALPVEGSTAASSELCRVLDVAAGDDHFICCDDRGRVYSWGGQNEYGQLGRGYAGVKDTEHTPQRIQGFGEDATREEMIRQNELQGTLPYSVLAQRPLPSICAVACGRHHSVLLSATKCCVYTFGRGHRGQLGHGRSAASIERCIEIACIPRSVELVFGHEVKSVHAVAGSDHTTILFSSGTVFSFGDNTLGVCGTGSAKALDVPDFAAFVEPRTGSVVPTETADDVEKKRLAAIRAPYGTPESYRYSKRVKTIAVTPAGATPVVESVSVSPTHAVALARSDDGTLGCYSTGLRPIRVVGLDSHVDSLGALGRPLATKASALAFGRMFFGGRVSAAGKRTGVHVRLVAGNGFTAMLESGNPNAIYLHGAIAIGGKSITGTGKKKVDNSRRAAASPSSYSAASSPQNKSPTPTLQAAPDDDDGTTPAVLNMGPGRKAVDIFAAGNGLIILADDTEEANPRK